MSSVNEVNAIIRERARIREAVVNLPTIPSQDVSRRNEYIKREDVLAILSFNDFFPEPTINVDKIPYYVEPEVLKELN